jgi:ABC-type branched-subunit amino acid transport system substrate-binding protein
MAGWGNRRWRTTRSIAVMAALALVAGACSGNKSATGAKKAPSQVAAGAPESTTTTGAIPANGAPAVKTTTTTKSSAKRTVGGVGSGPAVAGTKQTTASSGFAYTAANLFTADQDRVGITDSALNLCIHAPLVFGPAFQDSADDFQVYWKWLNDNGGIYGRKVTMNFTDDQYTPQGGVAAAQQCQQTNPFLMMSGVGFDTVPAVRQWAEANKMLYLASFATETGLDKLNYSFELPPSVEHFGQVAGNYVGTKYPGKMGIVWRNSPNWQGGRDNFAATVKSKNSTVVVDRAVSENQGDYSQEILALQAAGAQTVLAWVNVLEFAQLEKQAAAQGYHPRWVTAAFNLVTDTLGHDVDGTNGPPAVALWVTPEYHNGDTSSPWSGEEKAMQAAYAKYDSSHTITDTDWQVWLAFKQTSQIFNDCGKDCTRNKLAGMFLSGYKLNQDPLCPVDFARGKGKIGSFAFDVMEGTVRGGGSGWKQVATCAETF